MDIHLNGEKRTVEGPCTVTALLIEIGMADRPVLVELDGVALLPREHETATVSEGARVELIRVVAGG